MLKDVAEQIGEVGQEWGQNLSSGASNVRTEAHSRWFVWKRSFEGSALSAGVKGLTSWGIADVAGRAASVAVSGVVGIVMGTGVTAYINHLRFQRKEQKITDEYRPQIAAWLGKDEKTVNVADMHEVAKANPALGEAIKKYRGVRNAKTITSLIASAITFGVAMLAFSAFAFSAGTVLGVAVLGFATMQTSYYAALPLTKKILGLNKPIVIEKVQSIQKMVKIEGVNPTHVMSLQVASDKDLAANIQTEYGKPFDALDISQKAMVMERFGYGELKETATALNKKELDPQELSFLVHGQTSGYVLAASRIRQMTNAARAKAQEVGGNVRDYAGHKTSNFVAKLQKTRAGKSATDPLFPQTNPASALEGRWQEYLNQREPASTTSDRNQPHSP